MLSKSKGIQGQLCTLAYDEDARLCHPQECAECESPCRYGLEYLTALPAEKFFALFCGGECAVCRQPCNLRRISLLRGALAEVQTGKESEDTRHVAGSHTRKRGKPKTWMEIALVPYQQRHGKERGAV